MRDVLEEAKWALLEELNKKEDQKILNDPDRPKVLEVKRKEERTRKMLENMREIAMDDYEKWLNSGNFDSDSIEDHEEYLEEKARKDRLKNVLLVDSGYVIPNFYGKYR